MHRVAHRLLHFARTEDAQWLACAEIQQHLGDAVRLAAASPADNLGPPESVRWRVPLGSFLRLGLLNLDPRDPEHADLLTDAAPARALARWADPLLDADSALQIEKGSQ